MSDGMRPTQAVMLAGGRGRRMRPFTDSQPKAMFNVGGRPFLGYLVEMLKAKGFERLLLLLGYLPQPIVDYIGDGRRFGMEVSYSITSPEDETGRRIAQVAGRLDPVFLLLYCDNYWPMRFDEMWARFQASEALGQLTVYDNRDEYTWDNVTVDREGLITTYEKGRATPGLAGVEIGFALFRREALGSLPEGNVSFEATVYPALVAQRKLAAYVTAHRYYSVGGPERLAGVERLLAGRPAVILDRDGVINRKPPRAEYVRRWEEFEWLPGTLEALRLLRETGYRIIVVSNQAGIARGMMSEADLEAIHQRMRAEVEASGGRIDGVYYCPHGWKEGCGCRKPKPGLLFEAQRDFAIDLTKTVCVGDDERDEQASRAAGCRWMGVTGGRSLLDIVRALVREEAEATASPQRRS